MGDLLPGRSAEYFAQHNAEATAREIAQQPRVWRQLADILRGRKADIARFMDEMKRVGNLRVIFTGAGSSAFIGTSLQMMLARELGLESEAVATTDIVSAPDCVLYDIPTLLVSFARSGESPESLAAIGYAGRKISRLYNLVITCNADSTLARSAAKLGGSLVLNMPPDSNDAGFAMTSSVSCMALAAFCVFGWENIDPRIALLEQLADTAEKGMDGMDEVAKQVASFDYDRLIYLGSGALKGLAQEGAVKSLELTNGYVNASFDTSMGFRHGPKTVVKPKTLTVHYLSPEEATYRYDIDLVREMAGQKQGNRMAVLQPAGLPPVDGADYACAYPMCGGEYVEMCAYIQCLLFTQLLSLEKSIERGVPTDSPSVGGEVNRVVKGVTIYEYEA